MLLRIAPDDYVFIARWKHILNNNIYCLEGSGIIPSIEGKADSPPEEAKTDSLPVEAKTDSPQSNDVEEEDDDEKQEGECAPPDPCAPQVINEPGVQGYQQAMPDGTVQGQLILTREWSLNWLYVYIVFSLTEIVLYNIKFKML